MNDDEEHKVPKHRQDSFNNHNSSMSNHENRNFSKNRRNSNDCDEGVGNYQINNKVNNGGGQSTNKKYLQNFLNQNLSQSDIQSSGGVNSALGINQQLYNGVVDPRKNDSNYACLLIKRMEFFCSKVNLEKHSNYLFRIFDRQEQSPIEVTRKAQIKIKLPDNTKPDILLMFIDYIDKGKEFPDKIDLYIAQNIVTISESLKMRALQKKFLLDIIMPMLNRENVIFFIKMAYNKLSENKEGDDEERQNGIDPELESVTTNKEEEDFWLEFLSYSLDLAAANIQYILKTKSAEIHGVLEPNIIDEVIERAIKFYRADLQYDNTSLFDALMKIRGCDSIFQLLDQEKQKIIDNEKSILQSGVKPLLTWKVQNLSGNFYRESDGFWVENAQWKLAISYFSNEEDTLSVQLKLISNPGDIKSNKDYFKKKDFFLPSNTGMLNQNFIDDYEEQEIYDQEEIQQRRKQIEKANAEYPSHSYITMVSAVRIHQNEELKDPTIQSLICSSKAPALLKKFQDFYPEDYNGEVTVEIYFKVKFIYSAILHYITRNFTYLITDPIIQLLPKDQFKLILKHKFLSVTQEDEVVKALCLWIEGQDSTDKLKQVVQELLENVQWNYVSIACFLDIIRNFSTLRRNDSFKKIVQEEFNLRLKFKPEQTKLQPPRFCYKYNKTQTNPESVAKNLKNAQALLYINHEDFFQKLLDQMLEPIDIIRSHLVNEGISENGHRKFLELQLQQKQKELMDIQNQLNNMKLIEEMGQSRSNSRLNQHTSQSRNINNRSSLDEQETIKNSMINLLNVIDGDQQQQQQQVFQNQSNFINQSNFGEHLKNVSHEFVAKMQNNANIQQSAFDIYENQQQPGKNNKVKIMFHTQSDEEEDYADGDDKAKSVKTEKVNLNGQVGGDDNSQDFEDENDDEEEKELFNAENLRTSNAKQSNIPTHPTSQNNNKQGGRPTSQLSQELNNFNPDQSNLNFQRFTEQQEQMPSFNDNSIIYGGGNILATSNNNDRREEEVIVHENREIQTSLQLILTTSYKKSRQVQSSQASSRIDSHRYSNVNQQKIMQAGVDQSIQMSMPSQRDQDNSSEFKVPQKTYADQSIQFEEIALEEVLKMQSQTIITNHDQENEEESNSSINNRCKDLQQSQVLQDDNVSQSRFKNRNYSVDIEQEVQPTYMTQNILNQQQINKSNLQKDNQRDQKYIQEIKEYTQVVQQLSKDVFDNNFLDQYNSSAPNINDSSNSYPLSFDQRTSEQASFIVSGQAKISQGKPNQNQHLFSSNTKSSATQPFTPMSNAQNSNVSTFPNNNVPTNLNVSTNCSSMNQSKIKYVRSPKNSHYNNSVNKNGSISVNNQAIYQTEAKQPNNETAYNQKQSHHQRAKSQATVIQQNKNTQKLSNKELNNTKQNQRYMSLNQSAIEIPKSNKAILSNKAINKTQISMKQNHHAETRNKNSIGGSSSYGIYNSGFSSTKNANQSQQVNNFNQTINNINTNVNLRSKTPIKPQHNQFQALNNRSKSKMNQIQGSNNQTMINSRFQSIPTSTKNNYNQNNVLSLQKLLEGTNQSLLSMNFGNGLNQDLKFNVPQSLLGWTGTQDQLNNLLSSTPQNQTISTVQQNFITNQIHMNEIKNPVSFDLTAQIANFNILDHIQKQHIQEGQQQLSSQQQQKYNQIALKNNINKPINFSANNLIQQQQLSQGLLSYGQSPSSQYQQNLNNIYLDISKAKNTNQNIPQNYLNQYNRLGTIEEQSKQSDLFTSHPDLLMDKQSQQSSSQNLNNQQQRAFSFNQTQPLQQQFRNIAFHNNSNSAINSGNIQSNQSLSGIISPQSIISNNQNSKQPCTNNISQTYGSGISSQQYIHSNVGGAIPQNQTISQENERGGQIQ